MSDRRLSRVCGALPLTLALLSAAPQSGVGAQTLRPSTTGFSLAAGIGSAQVATESQGVRTSAMRPAARAELAYGATPRVSLLGAVSQRSAALEQRAYTVRSLDLGGRYLALVGRELRPFAEGGLAIRAFALPSAAGTISATDVGPWGAVGGMWFPGGRLAVDAALTYGRVTFRSWTVDGSVLSPIAPLAYRELGARVAARWYLRAR